MTLRVSIAQRLGQFELDVNFDAPAGVTVLFGKSGSGKTSVINAVAGLTKPDRGHIDLNGNILTDADRGVFIPPHKRQLGYVFQDARLFPHLTVAKNLDYGARFAVAQNTGMPRDQVIDMLGLGALLTRRPQTLSGGEKQRVAIGRALLSRPRMLLADEPLAALDDARKANILPYFERLRDTLSIPILYVSHSTSEVARLANTIVVLEGGRVQRVGPARDVLSDPRITPLGVGAAGAMIEAKVHAHQGDGLTELSAKGTRLLIPTVPCEPGQTLRVHVAAQDVMIATREPRDISALNVVPAIVRKIRKGDGPGAMVQLEAGENLILSRITQRSLSALSLTEGQSVFAVLKAVSVSRDSLGKTKV